MINQQLLHGHPPNTVLLSGKRVQADVKSFKVGVFDEIREDVRRFSTVQPVDEVLLERVEAGWEGVLYSKRDAFLFVFSSAGFVAKQVNGSDSKVMQYAYGLVDKESAATRAARAREAQEEQAVLNAKHNAPSTVQAGDLGTGTVEEKRFTGPATDAIRRDLAVPRPVLLTQAVSPDSNLAAGGVVTNKAGKLLIVKPKNGYGGYDWTFPKGGLESDEYQRFGVDGAESAAKREILEETGYRVTVGRLLAKVLHEDGGTCYYFAMTLDGEGSASSTDDEISQMQWVTATEALELLHEDDDIKVLSLATMKTPRLVIKADKLPGGLADNKTSKDFDKEQLDEGTRVEREHTKDDAIAAEIARDHLTEDKDYYKKLKKIEKRLPLPKLMVKALPRQSKAAKEAKNKKQGARPIAASSKKAGAGGKTRYNYLGEKSGPKPPEPKAESHVGGHQSPDQRPSTEMDPVVVPKDGKRQDPPKHTVDLSPLLAATKMDRKKWERIAKRFGTEQMGKRRGFVQYMQVHLKDLASKYSLDGDYFGLVYDVLTGANPGVKPPTSQNK